MGPETSALLNSAREHFRHNRHSAAEGELRAILSQEPSNIYALLLLAGIHFRTGQFSEASAALNLVFQADPNQKDAIGLMALIRKAQGDFVGAAGLFERLINLGQAGPDIYSQLGSCWLEAGEAVPAGVAFKRAVELDRGNARNYYNLGLALKMAGKKLETFATFKRAIQLDPDFHDSYVQLWEQMRQLVFWNQGLPLLEQGLARHPESTQMKVMLAITYGNVGQPERAEELFKSALAADGLAGPPYAHWLQEAGRFEESIPVLQESIRRKPLQGQAYYNLAIAKCFEVDGKSLVELVAPLLTEESIDREERMFLYYALAKNYDQSKDYEQAMANYDLANNAAFEVFDCEANNASSG